MKIIAYERNGEMEIELLDYTKNAEDLLIFVKHTRRMDSSFSLQEIAQMDKKEKQKELSYILKTISGPWEFIDYTFFIKGVTRAFTHQLVRHRIGTSFAQQSLRMGKKDDFNFLSTGKAVGDPMYEDAMKETYAVYRDLVEGKGISPQDARGILPTNILTNITMKINLRALNTMMNTRLCVRTAGEFQNVAKKIREKAVEIHPWTESVLLPFCLEWGVCKFQNFDKCPVKRKFNILQKGEIPEIENYWREISGISPQPK
jgi:thymidylate synthase (FAD)